MVNRTLFFVEVKTGDIAGSIVHPRPQTALENCTWHNLNVVRTDKRYVLVAGNYQSGVSVVDFTNPADASEIAYADPAPVAGARKLDHLNPQTQEFTIPFKGTASGHDR